MTTYIVLSSFADRAFRGRKDSIDRAHAVREMAQKMGSCVRHIYWTTGGHDVVALLDAPDEEWVAKFALALGHTDNVRTQILSVQREELKGAPCAAGAD